MNAPEFVNKFTGLIRGLMARKNHPNNIEVLVIVTSGNKVIAEYSQVDIVYREKDNGIQLGIQAKADG